MKATIKPDRTFSCLPKRDYVGCKKQYNLMNTITIGKMVIYTNSELTKPQNALIKRFRDEWRRVNWLRVMIVAFLLLHVFFYMVDWLWASLP